MQKKEFIRQLNELVPRPDPVTTEALYRFDRECAETEYIDMLTALRVVEFDGNDQPLRTTDLPLSEDMPTVTAGADAAWVAVEEESAEGVERTSYSLTEGEPVVHEVILLDEDGRGWGVDLTIGQ